MGTPRSTLSIGEHRITCKPAVNSDQIKRKAAGIVDAFYAELSDPDFKRFAEAKRSRNQKLMGQLIPILRERYGEKALLRLMRSIS